MGVNALGATSSRQGKQAHTGTRSLVWVSIASRGSGETAITCRLAVQTGAAIRLRPCVYIRRVLRTADRAQTGADLSPRKL